MNNPVDFLPSLLGIWTAQKISSNANVLDAAVLIPFRDRQLRTIRGGADPAFDTVSPDCRIIDVDSDQGWYLPSRFFRFFISRDRVGGIVKPDCGSGFEIRNVSARTSCLRVCASSWQNNHGASG